MRGLIIIINGLVGGVGAWAYLNAQTWAGSMFVVVFAGSIILLEFMNKRLLQEGITPDPQSDLVLEAARLVANLQSIVDEQAEDEGLWFVANTAPEMFLQLGLRRLHAAIEGSAALTPGTTDCEHCEGRGWTQEPSATGVGSFQQQCGYCRGLGVAAAFTPQGDTDE